MIFNPKNPGWKTGQYPLFMGPAPALHDTINVQYPAIAALATRQVSQRWVFDEFNHAQSRMDLLHCPENIYKVMLMNLAYQWEADSVAARGIPPVFAPFVTNPELWEALMENANMECVVPETEVLTPRGWVRIDALRSGVAVAQYDVHSNEISFAVPSRIVERDHSGDMVTFSGRQVHQVVTPNHRMPAYETRAGKVHWKVAEDQTYYACNGLFTSGLNKFDRHLTTLERFYIAAQADGSVSDRYTGDLCGTIPVRFGLKKARKILRLEGICRELGFNIFKVGSERDNGVQVFQVDVPVSDLPPCGLKSLAWVEYETSGEIFGKQFLEEVAQWDGSTHNAGNCYYTSTVGANADVVATVAHLAGVRVTRTRREDVRSQAFSDTFIVNWTSRRTGHSRFIFGGSGISKEVNSYTGKVYCLTVPTGAFLVRSSGVISVTGNCTHAKTYSEIVRQCVPAPNEVFALVMESEQALARADTVNAVLDAALTMGALKTLRDRGISGYTSLGDSMFYDAAMMAMVALYALERIQFMSSFAATFAIVEQGYFQSIGKAVQKIMLDELFVHAALDREVLRIELATEQGADWLSARRRDVRDILDETVQREVSWAPYLLSSGRNIVGYTVPLATQWTAWNAAECYNVLGVQADLAAPNKSPLPWMDNWIYIDRVQNAMQELDGSNYALNVVKNDIDDGTELDF